MELFIPSLTIILFAVAIAYFLLPNLAPIILTGGSAVLLIGALYLHYSKFGKMEYERATWQYNLKRYVTWVIVGAVFIGAIGFWAINKGAANSVLPESVTSAISSPAMPSMMPPTVGGGFRDIYQTASSRVRELMRHGRISN